MELPDNAKYLLQLEKGKKGLNVKRSDGTIEAGWKIRKPVDIIEFGKAGTPFVAMVLVKAVQITDLLTENPALSFGKNKSARKGKKSARKGKKSARKGKKSARK